MKTVILLLAAAIVITSCRQPEANPPGDAAPASSEGTPEVSPIQAPETPPVSEQVPGDFNAAVMAAVSSMPSGGGYETSAKALKALISATVLDQENLLIRAELAKPSYCSGATYLVFLKALAGHYKANNYASPTLLESLLVKGQLDGVGVWGRWNANGPGTARFFYETGMGVNFDSWKRAKAGDFMKIFWSEEIGKKERGHSVVFLGEFKNKGENMVRYWSSNQKNGMGIAEVKKSSIKRVIFSRVSEPARLGQVLQMPKKDNYLSEMLTRSSTPAEMAGKTGLNQ